MDKFYKCKKCGKIVQVIKDSPSELVCCGEKMMELNPLLQDGAVEKHLPVIERIGNDVVVKVGDVPHPMQDVHYIEFIVLDTEKTTQRVDLKPGDLPIAKFVIDENDKVVDALAYCNLHGLWLTKE
jgi:superoxide reductase